MAFQLTTVWCSEPTGILQVHTSKAKCLAEGSCLRRSSSVYRLPQKKQNFHRVRKLWPYERTTCLWFLDRLRHTLRGGELHGQSEGRLQWQGSLSAGSNQRQVWGSLLWYPEISGGKRCWDFLISGRTPVDFMSSIVSVNQTPGTKEYSFLIKLRMGEDRFPDNGEWPNVLWEEKKDMWRLVTTDLSVDCRLVRPVNVRKRELLVKTEKKVRKY